MKKRIGASFAFVVALMLSAAFLIPHLRGQQASSWWTIPSGTSFVNCPLGTCSVLGQLLNLNGLSGTSILAADTAGSATNTLVNTGISFPIAANQIGKLTCTIFYTSGTSGGGLTLAVNGPGSPTELTQGVQTGTGATAVAMAQNQGTSWAAQTGTATTTTTTIQWADFEAGVENGTTAGTITLQYANVNTTGTVTVKRDSYCSFP